MQETDVALTAVTSCLSLKLGAGAAADVAQMESYQVMRVPCVEWLSVVLHLLVRMCAQSVTRCCVKLLERQCDVLLRLTYNQHTLPALIVLR